MDLVEWPNPQEVSDVVMDALISATPQARYQPGDVEIFQNMKKVPLEQRAKAMNEIWCYTGMSKENWYDNSNLIFYQTMGQKILA